MAASWLARRLGAALREAERQADLVAEIIAPGPLGAPSIKWPRDTQVAAERAVEAAKSRWLQASRGPQQPKATAPPTAQDAAAERKT